MRFLLAVLLTVAPLSFAAAAGNGLPTAPAAAWQLTIQSADGKSVTLGVDSSDTIETVKAQLQARTGIPAGKQRLSYEGKLLADNLTMTRAGIPKIATLTLTVEP